MRRRDAFHRQTLTESQAMAMTQKPADKPADPHSTTGDPRTPEQIERDRQAKFEEAKKAEDERETDNAKAQKQAAKNAPKEDGDNWRHADRPQPDPNAPRKGAVDYEKQIGPNEDPNSAGRLDPEV